MNFELFEAFWRIFSLLVLLILHALLVACELSVIKLSLSSFKPDFLERLKRRERLAELLENIDATVRVARIGSILCTFAYAVVAYPLLEDLLKGVEIFSGVLVVLLAFLLAVAIYSMVGELVPRSLAVSYPERALRLSSWAVKMVGWVTLPLLRPLRALVRLLLKPFGVELDLEIATLHIDEQLRVLREEREVSQVFFKIFKNTLHLRKMKVIDIVLPRNQVKYFNTYESNTFNIELAKRTGHTRFPLCEGDLDNCIGLIHIKDIFRSALHLDDLNLGKIKRKIIKIDPQESLDEALQKLLLTKSHMVLVVDEFGGTVGVITLESILEQLVGEIHDEFDVEEVLINPIREGEYLVSGLTPIRDLEEMLKVQIQNKDEVATFGGLITAELGRIPESEEHLTLDGMDIAIIEVDEKRVIATRVKVDKEPEGEGVEEE